MVINSTLVIFIAVAFIIWNIVAFMLFLTDKRRAVNKKWRIPESTLIFFIIAGAGIGSSIAMHTLRHKTQKTKFKIANIIGLIIALSIIAFIVYLLVI